MLIEDTPLPKAKVIEPFFACGLEYDKVAGSGFAVGFVGHLTSGSQPGPFTLPM